MLRILIFSRYFVRFCDYAVVEYYAIYIVGYFFIVGYLQLYYFRLCHLEDHSVPLRSSI